MTKEIHDINTRALDFVVELIEYIFEYPDDDYMTMECLCRKLHKYGLIEKKDGEWTTDFIERKDEPQTETKMKTQNSNLTFEKRTMRDCYNCKRYETEEECIECHYEPKDEPQTDCSWKKPND